MQYIYTSVLSGKKITLFRMTVKQVGHFVVVEVLDLGLQMFWDRGTRVNVQVDQKWNNHVRKLLKPGTGIHVLQRNTVFHR